MSTKEKSTSSLFVIRTTAGQEKNAAELIDAKARTSNLPILSILVPEALRGYIFIETRDPHTVDEAIADLRHAKSRIAGKVNISEVDKYLESKPVIEEIDVGYVVEITGGPFKGMRALVTKVNKMRHEATLELLEASFTLPVTVNADYLKLIEKSDSAKDKEG